MFFTKQDKSTSQKVKEIYDIVAGGGGVEIVGTITGNGTISATGISGYESLTKDDFVIANVSIPSASSGFTSGMYYVNNQTFKPSLSYNATNGTITLTGMIFESKLVGDSDTGYIKSLTMNATATVYKI